jgi:hypothetical protein
MKISQAMARPSSMKVACATIYDAQDPTAYDGRYYEQLQSIKRRIDSMYFLGPLRFRNLFRALSTAGLVPFLRLKAEYYRSVQQKTYFPLRDRLLVRRYANVLSRRLAQVQADIVFSPLSVGSQPIAYLECTQPIVIWTDSTFAGCLDFHDAFRRDRVCTESLRDGIENERAALLRAAALICYSEWAANTAIREYGVNPEKVRVIPPGPASEAGIEDLTEARRIIRDRPRYQCRLLFVGGDWVTRAVIQHWRWPRD